MKKTFLSELLVAERSQLSGNKLELNSGIYPVYGANGLVTYINFYEVDKPYLAVIKDGAGVGRVYKCPSKSSVLSTLQYLLPNSKIDLNYAYYWLSSLCLSKYAHGAAIPHIYYKDYKYESLLLPSLMVQKKIAERLDKEQELIAKQKEQIAKLDLLIKSRFLDMFGDPITNPKNWPLFPLGKFISISGGFAFPSSEFKESGLPIVRIGNINSGIFKDDHFVFYQENEKLRKYLVYPDDLVLSLTGTVGKDDYANICFIGKKYARYYLNQRNAKLVLTSNLDKTFIWQIFKSPEIKKRLTSLNRGVRQANISNQDILNLKVIYPDLFLQTQFANFVQSVEQQKEVFSARLSHLEVLYKSLIQEYFG